MAARRITKALHLQKTNLVETSSKDIDNMAIMGSSFSEIVVELSLLLAMCNDEKSFDLPSELSCSI